MDVLPFTTWDELCDSWNVNGTLHAMSCKNKEGKQKKRKKEKLFFDCC